ncbi:uncharacterized protein [Haliotis asinina]|uniref:uncharacterized protein n=1 Tax=Haliotis asinina TaxID=109174 RepID=UPI0035327986
MAESGMSEEEVKQLVSSLKKLDLRPKADTPQDLLAWISSVSKSTEEAKPSIPPTVTLAKTPQLPYFSGDRKGDVDFDQWKHEYTCLCTRYSEQDVVDAVHKSLRGKAARVAMHIDKDAPLNSLITKLDSVFGMVHTEHNIMAEFYTARQGEEESVADWACRLEDILDQAIMLGKVKTGERDVLLRDTLWTGLRLDLKDMSSHRYDQGGTLEAFLKYLRQLEQDLRQRQPTARRPATSKSSVTKEQSELQEIKGMLKSMTAEINKLKEQVKSNERPQVKEHRQGNQWNHHDQGQEDGYLPPRNWTRQPRSRGNKPFCQGHGRGNPTGRGDPGWFQGPQTMDDIPRCF